MDLISPDIEHLDLTPFMREAIKEAERSGQAGDLPIGAVLVIDGQIIARGRSARKAYQNQLRHAELNAMLEGGPPLWEHHDRAILVTTVEPCPLCLGAAVMADVPHVAFGLPDVLVHSGLSVETNPYIRRHIRTYKGGILAGEIAAMVARYHPAFLRAIGWETEPGV